MAPIDDDRVGPPIFFPGTSDRQAWQQFGITVNHLEIRLCFRAKRAGKSCGPDQPLSPRLSGGSAQLCPVRSDVGAAMPALRAPHPRAKRRHENLVRPFIDVEDGAVAAGGADYVKRPRAETAHIAKRHPGRRCVSRRRRRFLARSFWRLAHMEQCVSGALPPPSEVRQRRA